jgi:peptide/nickel transport system substrate-binding protein
MQRWRLLVACMLIALVASACGDSGGSESGSGATAAGSTTTGAPQSGGILNFGEFSEPAGLDPIVSLGHGTTGAIEMAAVYDTILRYDVPSKQYVNVTAESLDHNSDYNEWTLKLKPGIKFSDGTDYDAAAVVFGMNRHRSGLPGAPACQDVYACPRNSTSSGVYMALVKDMQAVDKLTVKFTLSDTWTSFPYALSAEPGMIPSPTALKKCDPTKPVNQCEFNLKPVGAGPFVVDSLKPKDSITMSRNTTYWDGPVYLDGIKFTNAVDSGGNKTYESFTAGNLQGAFLRAPETVAAAHAANVQGFSTMEQGGGQLLLNQGATVTCAGGKPEPTCTGKPDGPTSTNPVTKDLKVRQAVAAAIDPNVINQRANAGKGLPGSQLLQSDFRWYPNVPGPKYDLNQAKQLVTEAKAAGWDGKIRLLFNNSPTEVDRGLALQTMLQAAGMDASLDTSKDTAGQIAQVATAKDFDISTWGISISPDDGAQWALAQNMASTSASNRVGYKNPAVDQALKDLLHATTDEQKTAQYKIIAERYAQDLPFYIYAKVEEFIVFSPKVHGVIQANRGIVRLNKAWMEK